MPPAYCYRLQLYRYDGLEFVPLRDVALPEAPTCLACAGGATLYLGLKRCAEGGQSCACVREVRRDREGRLRGETGQREA